MGLPCIPLQSHNLELHALFPHVNGIHSEEFALICFALYGKISNGLQYTYNSYTYGFY